MRLFGSVLIVVALLLQAKAQALFLWDEVAKLHEGKEGEATFI